MLHCDVRALWVTVVLAYTVKAVNLRASLSAKVETSESYATSYRKTCSLGIDEINRAKCKLPNSVDVVSYFGSTVTLPQYTICETDPIHSYCVRCEHGIWQPSQCSVGPHRIKRSLWFLEDQISDCLLFCDKDKGGLDLAPPGFVSCESPQSPLFANRGKTATSVAWPHPVARDSHGTTLSVRSISGEGTPGEVFERGRHQIIYEATSDNGLSSHCFIAFEVRVLSCHVPVIANGNRICDNINHIYGTVCNISCNEGYVIEGSPQLVCHSNEKWNQALPTCSRKTCPSLSTFTCSESYNYGSVCEINCNYSAGQSPPNHSRTYCLRSGEWKLPMPSCVDTAPPVFKNCPVGNVIAYTDSDSTQTTVTYDDITADDNYGSTTITKTGGPSSGSVLSVGTTAVSYMAEDANRNIAECDFNITLIAPRCSKPLYSNTHLTYTCDNGYYSTSTCTIGCSDGYTFSGSNSIVCESDNTLQPSMVWAVPSGQPPSCQRPLCPALNTPTNGNLTCDSNSVGQFCSAVCHANWDYPRNIKSHSNLFACGSAGEWVPYNRVPDCTVKRIPSEMRQETSISYYASTCEQDDGDQIMTNLMSVVNSSVFYSGTNCSSTTPCSVKDVSFVCETASRRGRNAEEDPLRRYKRSDSALVATWFFSVEYNCGSMSVSKCVTYHETVLKELIAKLNTTLHNGDINSTAPGYQIRQDSLNYYYADFHCGEGMLSVLNTGSCAVCPTGTMYNSTGSSCDSCPRGSYQDGEHSFSCKPCPTGTTTVIVGAWTAAHCKVQCQAGWVSTNGIQPCFPCHVGTYQQSVGSTSCEKCPLGSTTDGSGSVSPQQCHSFEYSIIGPSELQSIARTRSLSDFTVLTWVKVRRTGTGSTLSFGGTDLSLGIGQQVTVSVKGQTTLSATLDIDKWTHIGVVFKQSTNRLTLYFAGRESSSKIVAFTNIISTSSTMRLIVGNGDEISMRHVQLLNRHISAGELATMSSTCNLSGEDDTVLSMETLQKSSGVVSIVSPSSCDAVDECMTSSCNGHQCINTPSSYVCQCHNGYTGSDCSIAPDFCINHQCQNEASCISGAANYTCECAAAYKGTLCEHPRVDGGYSGWTSWSVCSVSCGGGSVTRTRTCDNPTPDKGGISCSGPDQETRSCSSEPCPVCSAVRLQDSFESSVPDCNGTVSELHCRPTCDVGYFTSKKQVSVYTCRDGVWSPSLRLPPCFRIVAPESLMMTAQVNYTNQGCPTTGQAETLKMSVSKKLESLSCQSHGECVSRVVVPECSTTDSITSAFFYFTIALPDIELDIENYVRNKVISTGLAKVIEAIRTLEMTGVQLQDTGTKVLEVTTSGTTYTPVYPAYITTSIVCPRGTFPEDGFCGECPPGTHYTDSTKSCVLCERGTYRTTPRSLSCDSCPDGKSTLYTGSTLASDCSEEGDSASKTSTETSTLGITTSYATPDTIKDPVQPNNNMALIVGSVFGFLVLIALVVIVFVFMKRRKSLPENKPHHYETGFHFANGTDYLTAVKDPENVYSEMRDPDTVLPPNPYYHHIGNERYIPCDPREDETQEVSNPCNSADTAENAINVYSNQAPENNNGRASYVPMVNNVDLFNSTEDKYENPTNRDSPIDPYYQ